MITSTGVLNEQTRWRALANFRFTTLARAALFLDEDSLTCALIRGLRSDGVEVLTAAEAVRRRLSDEEQLEFATSQGRPVFVEAVERGGNV